MRQYSDVNKTQVVTKFVARMEDSKSAFKILTGKPTGKDL